MFEAQNSKYQDNYEFYVVRQKSTNGPFLVFLKVPINHLGPGNP